MSRSIAFILPVRSSGLPCSFGELRHGSESDPRFWTRGLSFVREEQFGELFAYKRSFARGESASAKEAKKDLFPRAPNQHTSPHPSEEATNYLS